ncbi:MAG: hypothetical protein JXB15_17040 [Anaerolineales bacterium]|nr:hypothetical protein [Anaerolineales bacterium]
MPSLDILAGRERAWSILRKLGEGDAGEVYLVESLLDKQVAVLKKPRHSAFTSDVVRQASQIEREARILEALSVLDKPESLIHTPRLLDQARSGTEFTDRYFIIITLAQGFQLNQLAQLARRRESNVTPRSEIAQAEISPAELGFLQHIASRGAIPDLILLRLIRGLIEFLEKAHSFEINTPSQHYYGVIWNDIKPDHFFWNPHASRVSPGCFTAIDWGNGQFLEADGATTDRTLSRIDDYAQLLDEMGRFLSSYSPELLEKLAWQHDIPPGSAYSEGVLPLKVRLDEILNAISDHLRQLRRQERDILDSALVSRERYLELAQVQTDILDCGEIPDEKGYEDFFQRLIESLLEANQFVEISELCAKFSQAASLFEPEKWHLVGHIAKIVSQQPSAQAALQAALVDDWPTALWELQPYSTEEALSSEQNEFDWEALCLALRSIYLHTSPQEPTPLVALKRLIHTLQAAALSSPNQPVLPQDTVALAERLSRNLREEILPRWLEPEPDPPDSGLEYREVERYLVELEDSFPSATQPLVNALNQPRAQVNIVLDAWGRMDFEVARRGLRHLLIWDPDRRRILQADRVILSASGWLNEVRRGPQKDEPLLEYVTNLELEGRELRSRVGPAHWLDGLLEAFAKLRKGAEPTAVIMEYADLRGELGWLIALDPRRPMLSQPGKPIHLERGKPAHTTPTFQGAKETRIGAGHEFYLTEPLDTWAPEARGSSARVFLGHLQSAHRKTGLLAVKLMRPDVADYALPLFREEAQALTILRDVPGVAALSEMGFILLDKGMQLPPENQPSSDQDLQGQALRYGADSVHRFLSELAKKVEQGWLPYLAIERMERSDNLLFMCDVGYTRGRFLPLLEGLRMAIQICHILEAAHARNIIYRDHKILHYYWQEKSNNVYLIDWNITKRQPQGLSKSEIQFDLVQFAARALHYIITGRAAPGALPLGPTRAEEIEAAARTYPVQWTYDDQRLPKEARDILERSLAGEYAEAKSLREDLENLFRQLYEVVKPAAADEPFFR